MQIRLAIVVRNYMRAISVITSTYFPYPFKAHKLYSTKLRMETRFYSLTIAYPGMSGHVGISSNVQAHMENHPYVAFQAISN